MLCTEEGDLSRKLALDCEHGDAQEEYTSEERARETTTNLLVAV